jgi:predicted 3-demethylubiquinone-9 3-methyltransferase (glyoxalase superfamily)
MVPIKQRIVPHLWYDTEAKDAAEFYVSAFPDSKIIDQTTLQDTPSGDTDVLTFELCGQRFMAISAGPYFTPNPSISFFVNFDPAPRPDARQALDLLWTKLSEGGTPLMPLDRYPFSERYGWIADKYGVSWQLILTDPEGEPRPDIVPSLLFVGDVCGKAEEATDFYLSVFKNSRRGQMSRYPAGMLPDQEGTIQFTDFMLEGQWFAAMDSALDHAFSFNEGISFIVYCDTQEEIDYYWNTLSAVREAEQCGWLKDPYGVSWQIVPRAMDEMMSQGSPQQVARVTQAFLDMKKFDLAALQRAYDGE